MARPKMKTVDADTLKTALPATSTSRRNHLRRAVTKRRYTDSQFLSYHIMDDAADLAGESGGGDVQAAKKRKTTDSNTKAFPLLRLPAEIRNIIYNYCLKHPRIVIWSETGAFSVRLRTRGGRNGAEESTLWIPALTPSLLATSREINNEAAPIPYGQSLGFSHPDALHSFLAQIGSSCKLVKSVTIENWPPGQGRRPHPIHPAFVGLAPLPEPQARTARAQYRG
ncbi:hypothetical protein H2201_008470 [Coniosporium apollinis]|uniref:2EXR domain-containing protein n=1 Tax=Coniosporium apollinis TaxID=61459 RepID=A0ABQ9NGV7_9PEZI|nr:hypothetical protein H2201_008470 [Coniosporium apollinis]